MIDETLARFIDDVGLAYVATIDAWGSPCLSPKASWVVLDATHLAFCDIASAGTRRNVQADPRVAVNVVDVLQRRGYRLRGSASVHGPGETTYDRVAAVLWRRHGSDYPVDTVISMAVEHVEQLRSPAYRFGGADEHSLATASLQGLQERMNRR